MFLAVPVCHYRKRIAVRLRTASVSPRIVVRSFSDAVDAPAVDRTLLAG